ncbi:alpha-soluble NSF attachment protein-like [Oppia nitens]|uniref:alpha-soluble NSF attachment protein-like n=1 Tax=Oppia nitens TaxID=1686743 RepID=UPI0023DC0F0D|nr:alpha-soluble NSF attachment protein-like [Oppia nitens]XP_054164178.1 alpha-soluble NSF attachment protein-like [Oppia nitens]
MAMSTNSDREAKARQLMAEADKKLTSFNGLFGNLLGKPSNAVEEAIDLYIKAGNQFKMCQKWDLGAKVFTTAARLQSRTGERHESATSYVLAANCFRKYEPYEAIGCLTKVIEIYEELGRLAICAKHHTTVAEIYETHLHDTDTAVKHYQSAADCYRAEHSLASANKCLLFVANSAALSGQYQRAIDTYEEVAKHCIESSLLKYSAHNHFMRAALCHICIDLLNGELAIKRYEDLFPAFSDSREYKLVNTLIGKLDDNDIIGYTAAIKAYDSISRMDPWFVSILLTIKNKYNTDSDPDMK